MGGRRSKADLRRRQEKEEVAAALPFTIDINADIGEGPGTSRIGTDSRILALVSSANIACGYHAGDATSMRETVRAARDSGVAIGAHPSYPDLPGFGRRELDLPAAEITRHVIGQITTLARICGNEHTRLAYVKPHGALYNRAARDISTATAVTDAIVAVDATLVLLGLGGSAMQSAASRAGIAFVSEAFVDRAYCGDLQLVRRGEEGALITDENVAAARALRMITEKTVTTVDGSEVPLDARSLCVHGDNSRAVDILTVLRAALASAGVRIAPFTA